MKNPKKLNNPIFVIGRRGFEGCGKAGIFQYKNGGHKATIAISTQRFIVPKQ